MVVPLPKGPSRRYEWRFNSCRSGSGRARRTHLCAKTAVVHSGCPSGRCEVEGHHGFSEGQRRSAESSLCVEAPGKEGPRKAGTAKDREQQGPTSTSSRVGRDRVQMLADKFGGARGCCHGGRRQIRETDLERKKGLIYNIRMRPRLICSGPGLAESEVFRKRGAL